MFRLLTLALLGLPLIAQAADEVLPAEGRSLSLTVYNSDLAVVRDRRSASLPQGDAKLIFAEVSPRMQAETARLAGEGISVSEDTLSFDVVSPANLLRRAVGSEVTLVRPATGGGREEPVRARLLSEDGPVLEIDGHVEVAPPGRLVYDRLPDGLVAHPTLSLSVTSGAAGRRDLDLTYLTQGLSWRAEYLVQVDESEDKADLLAWAILTNTSGAAFPKAKLNLVAGDVHRVAAVAPAAMRSLAMPMAAPAPMAAGPNEQSLAGATLYTLPGAVSIDDRETKQLALFHADGVAAHRELVVEPMAIPFYLQPFDAAQVREPDRPQSMLVIDGPSLSKVLPQGLARVFKRDAGGAPQLLGEDSVRQTARQEPLRLVLGRDGDVLVSRAQTVFRRAQPANEIFEAGWQITLSNAKDKAVVVRIHEPLPVGMVVAEESVPHESPDPRSLTWSVSVPAHGQAVLTYRIHKTPG